MTSDSSGIPDRESIRLVPGRDAEKSKYETLPTVRGLQWTLGGAGFVPTGSVW